MKSLVVALVLLLATRALAGSQQVNIRIGMDDWVSASPFKFGETDAAQASGFSSALISAIKTRALAQVSERFGSNLFGNATLGYTVTPIGVGDPYRLISATGAWGWFKSLFLSSKPAKARLYELTFSNDPSKLPVGANYTGLYKGPIRTGDILASGLYTITQESALPFVGPTVIEIYMVSAIPGITVGSITNENFAVWSPQYGSGIAEIQVISGDTPNSQGQIHIFIQNNFYFPAPEGVSTIPPVRN